MLKHGLLAKTAAMSTTAQSRLRQSVLHCCGPASLKPLHSPGLEPDLALLTSTPSFWCLRRDKAEATGEEQRRSGIRKFAIELRLPLPRTLMLTPGFLETLLRSLCPA